MGVCGITEDWEGLGGEDQADLRTLIRTGDWRRRFQIEFDDTHTALVNFGAVWTASHGGITVPAVYDLWPGEIYIFAVKRAVTHKGSPKLFQMDVEYKKIENPLAEDPVIEWSFVASQEPIDKDRDGNEIANSARETFDPAVMEDFYDLVLRITRNESAFNPLTKEGYVGRVNSDSFLGFSAGKVKCGNISATKARYATTYFYPVTYEFLFRTTSSDPLNTGWAKRILDQGFRKKVASNRFALITEKDLDATAGDENVKVTSPVLLNGSGAILGETADPVFLTFNTKKTAAFGDLSISV